MPKRISTHRKSGFPGVCCLLTIACCSVFSTAGAQRLSIGKSTVDVGRTAFQMPVTATFEMKNKGLRHLYIQDVKVDCGCSKVDFPTKGIAPGEKFKVSMTYDARQLGHFVKQAAIYSNDSKSPVYVKMKGVVLAEVVDMSNLFPYSAGCLLTNVPAVEFDDVKQGDHPTSEILIVNNGDKVAYPNVLHLPPYLTAQVSPQQLAPGRTGKVTLTLNTAHLHDYGLTQTSVYLAGNIGEKVSADTEIPVSLVMVPNTTLYEGDNKLYAPKLQLSSDSLVMGRVNGKTVKKSAVTLVNKGRQPLKISSLQMFTKGMQVTLDNRELQPGASATLKVSINRDELLKARTKPRVLMITNDPDHAKVVIKIDVK